MDCPTTRIDYCLSLLHTVNQHQLTTSHSPSMERTEQLYVDEEEQSDDSTSDYTPHTSEKKNSADKIQPSELHQRRPFSLLTCMEHLAKELN